MDAVTCKCGTLCDRSGGPAPKKGDNVCANCNSNCPGGGTYTYKRFLRVHVEGIPFLMCRRCFCVGACQSRGGSIAVVDGKFMVFDKYNVRFIPSPGNSKGRLGPPRRHVRRANHNNNLNRFKAGNHGQAVGLNALLNLASAAASHPNDPLADSDSSSDPRESEETDTDEEVQQLPRKRLRQMMAMPGIPPSMAGLPGMYGMSGMPGGMLGAKMHGGLMPMLGAMDMEQYQALMDFSMHYTPSVFGSGFPQTASQMLQELQRSTPAANPAKKIKIGNGAFQPITKSSFTSIGVSVQPPLLRPGSRAM